jgi:predicted phosphodiesterase
MKYLIFSDTHLSAYEFDKPKFEKLVSLITQADIVIINGDFYDGYLCSFDEFVQSPWAKLFPLLKKKRAIYIYGNHDRPEYMDERVTEFSVEQTYRKELTVGRQQIIVQHGQNFAPDFDGRFPSISYYLAWFYPRYFYHEQNKTLINRFFLSYYAANKNKFLHDEMKRSITFLRKRNSYLTNEWFICGHSHIPEFNTKLRFVNSGQFSRGLAQYVGISNTGEISLQLETYYELTYV